MAERTNLSAVLKRYRLAASLSQEALAARAGLSTRAISDLERGLHRAPHADTLDRIATALALSSQQRAVFLAAAHPDLGASVEAPPAASYPSVPLPPTVLIGRERERAHVASMLLAGGERLLTLTGPSGVGKTRLALQIAQDVAAVYADGIVFIDLAAIHDAELVPGAIAEALTLREQTGSTLAEQVQAHLRNKHLLLVLDNCEHLLDAAPFVAKLEAGCPRLSILATSRAPLRLRAEQTVSLPPLPLEDAVALFRERALAAKPNGVYDHAEVAAICEHVDCLPLAIELAAGRVSMLSLPLLLDHLTQRLTLLGNGARDLPARQRTMEDAIGWSYDLLTENQQRCFRALGGFVGGCTLEAARAVCWPEATNAAQETILTLAALVDSSLVQAEIQAGGAARFRLLELVREYALERLRDADEEAQCLRRHAVYYANLAEIAMRLGPEHATGDSQLAQELSNARAALEWAESQGEAELGLRLSGFARLWHVRGQAGEAEQWLERMLALDARAREQDEHVASLTARVERLYGLARTLLGRGKMARAEARAVEAVLLARQIGDEAGMSEAYATVGLIAQASGAPERAAAAFRESDAHAQLADRSDLRTHALYFLAELARARGEDDQAAELLADALASASASRAVWETAVITTMQGHLARQHHHYAEAHVHYRASLPLFQTFGSPMFTAWCLEGFAATLCAEGQYALALRLCAAAATLRTQVQTPLPPAERDTFEHTVTAARTALGEPAYRAEWHVGARLTLDEAVAEALGVKGHERAHIRRLAGGKL